ncbi:MAG: hypothetical protein KF781_10670 [Chitinophagaceae bacterium]|nr:hypothetical protein [Chitinophagaceae bacterium]MCW5906123.1 hypothetical protein [Chitinophagaceae bacterium]
MSIVFFTAGCKSHKKIPDVTKINIELSTQRFEQDFFLMDTNQLNNSIQNLFEKYPSFSIDFLYNILAADHQPDSILKAVKFFIKAYNTVYTDSKNIFDNFASTEKEIKQGFQFVKYYFPKYTLPTQLITYIGPWDAFFMLSNNAGGSGVVRTDENIMAIGLQLSMGKDYAMYKENEMQQFYPYFISRRFDKTYIPVNVLQVIIDDLYQQKTTGKSLIEQMIEAGKRVYLLDAFLPNTADSVKIGYTQNQLDACYKSEAAIWSFFISNDLLYQTEPSIVMEYMNDAPKTTAFGDASPGFIGKFTGWQIVKKWMEKNNEKTLIDLLNTPAKTIFEQAKYKP